MATSKGSQTRIFRALFLKLLAPTFPPHISLVRQVEMKPLCLFSLYSYLLRPQENTGDQAALPCYDHQEHEEVFHIWSAGIITWVLIKTVNLHLSGFGWQKRAKEVQGVELPIHHQASIRQSKFHQGIYHQFTRQFLQLFFFQSEAVHLHNANETRWWVESDSGVYRNCIFILCWKKFRQNFNPCTGSLILGSSILG